MYEDEFELTFNLSGEEPQPEQAAQEPPVPPKPKAAAPVVDEPTRVMVLEKPQPAPQPEMPEPVQEEPEKTPAPTVQAAANGRCVLISGGDRGIGAAAARAFYAAGYRVAVLYHSNAKAAAELEKQLPGITAMQCDVASRASCELAFRTAEQALGRVDVLVSNAGIAQQKLFTDITPEEWQHMLDVNLTGAFHLCQLALPGMIRRKAGRILTVSSMWGQTGGSCDTRTAIVYGVSQKPEKRFARTTRGIVDGRKRKRRRRTAPRSSSSDANARSRIAPASAMVACHTVFSADGLSFGANMNTCIFSSNTRTKRK